MTVGTGCATTSFTLTSASDLGSVSVMPTVSFNYDPVFTYAVDVDLCNRTPVHSYTQSSVDGITLTGSELVFTDSTASFDINVNNVAYAGKSVDIVLAANLPNYTV